MATTITLYRSASPTVTIDIDEKTVFSQKIMGEHKIASQFVTRSVLDIRVGDYITYGGVNFYVNRTPKIKKVDTITYQYEIDFESFLYDLSKKIFLWPASNGVAQFSYNGMASDYITLIVSNMNATFSGWSSGTVDTTTYKTLTFSNESCRSALAKIADAFGLEYGVAGKVISCKAQIGSSTGYTFKYGKNQGLYSIAREQVNDQNIITKVFGFGSTKNIPSTYRSRAKCLVFSSGFLTKNTASYGIIEGSYTDETIYPRLLGTPGTLTAANIVFDGSNNYDPRASYITDSNLNFDLNAYLISGVTPKVVFTSGPCSGIEYEIWKYDNSNKRIYFNAYSDTDGYTTPFYNGGAPIKPATGNTYVLIGIAMPQTYIDTAETALQAATQAYLDRMSVPQVIYSIDFDPRYVRSNSVTINAGDKVTIVDTELGINNQIRIASISFPLVNPYAIKVLISDFIPYTVQEQSMMATVDTVNAVATAQYNSAEMSRQTSLRMSQMRELIYDPDGYFDVVNLKPLSIQTMYLSVGAVSTDFKLNGVGITPNYTADRSKLYVSAGTLVHNQINNGGNYVWTISTPLSQTGLVDATAYYLYAQCSKSAQTGTWVLSSTKKGLEDDAGQYNFWVGILFASVAAAFRNYDFTYGMTYITGNTITTGKIQSQNTYNYFDLDNNKFRVGDGTYSLDWNVSAAGQLTINGATLSNVNLAGSQGIVADYTWVATMGSVPQFAIMAFSDSYRHLNLGVPTSGNKFAFIQAVRQSDDWMALALNPNGGFLGIGTGNTLPTELLQIGDFGNVSTSRRAITLGGAGYGDPAALYTNSNGDKLILYNYSSGSAGDGRIGIGTIGDMWFKVNAAYRWYLAGTGTAIAEVMRLTNYGNISYPQLSIGAIGGILTHVTGKQYSLTSNAYLDNVGWKYKIAGFAVDFDLSAADGSFYFYSAASGSAGGSISWGTAKVSISYGGYVKGTYQGFGFPSYSGSNEWQIGSDATTGSGMYIYSGLSGYVFTMTSSGSITAYDYILSSDVRKKNNIKPYTPEYMDIDYYSYHFNNDPEQLRFGAGAQYIQDKYPELVRTDGKGDLSISYTDLLVREVAWGKMKIKELETRIKELEQCRY